MRVQSVFFPMPRHPLLRMLVLAVGLALLAGLIAISLDVGSVVLVVASTWLLVRRWLARRRRGQADPTIIEGEFSVLPVRQRDALPHGD